MDLEETISTMVNALMRNEHDNVIEYAEHFNRSIGRVGATPTVRLSVGGRSTMPLPTPLVRAFISAVFDRVEQVPNILVSPGEQGPNRSSRYRTAYKEILEDLIAGLDAEICKDESLSVSAWGSLLGDILDALDNAYVFHFDRLEVSNDWLIQIRWSAKHERFRDNLRELIRRTLADDALDASHRFDRCRKYLDYLARSIQTNMSGSSEMSPREEEAWTILSGRILAQLTRSIWFNHSALQRHIHRLNRAKSGKGSAIGSYGGLLRSICMATRTIDLAMTLKNKLDKVDCLTAKSDERNAFDAEADSAREYVAHYLPQVVTDLRGLIPQESGSREDQMFESVVSRAKRIAPDFEIKTAEAEQIETFQPA